MDLVRGVLLLTDRQSSRGLRCNIHARSTSEAHMVVAEGVLQAPFFLYLFHDNTAVSAIL